MCFERQHFLSEKFVVYQDRFVTVLNRKKLMDGDCTRGVAKNEKSMIVNHRKLNCTFRNHDTNINFIDYS